MLIGSPGGYNSKHVRGEEYVTFMGRNMSNSPISKCECILELHKGLGEPLDLIKAISQMFHEGEDKFCPFKGVYVYHRCTLHIMD